MKAGDRAPPFFSWRRLSSDSVNVLRASWPYARTKLLIGFVALLLLPLGRFPLPIGKLLLAYAGGLGWAFGIVVFLKPLIRSAFGAALVGALAVLPFILLVTEFANPGGPLRTLIIATVVSCVTLGSIPGMIVWWVARNR